jgi:hypothetical protein
MSCVAPLVLRAVCGCECSRPAAVAKSIAGEEKKLETTSGKKKRRLLPREKK